jgi:hypothetical protein
MEEEERKTEMGGGEGSTVLPSHGGLHRKKIREKRMEERERSVLDRLIMYVLLALPI